MRGGGKWFPLGWYLEQAALLNKEDIETILEEQKVTGVRFGTVAVRDFHDKKITIKDFHLAPSPTEPISEEEMEQMFDMMLAQFLGIKF